MLASTEAVGVPVSLKKLPLWVTVEPDSARSESPIAPAPSSHLARRPVEPVPETLAVPVSAEMELTTAVEELFVEAAALRSAAELRTVPSSKRMPPRARISPATSSVASGASVPMPTRPSGVTRICSLSSPFVASPVRKVSAPFVLVTCPSEPSCPTAVRAFGSPSPMMARGAPSRPAARAESAARSETPPFCTATNPTRRSWRPESVSAVTTQR
jgi:hypothetical protein